MKIRKYTGAGVLFWRKNGEGTMEVLLGLRDKNIRHAPMTWSLFGGGAHPEESAMETAMREAAEETANRKDGSLFMDAPFSFRKKPIRSCAIPFVYRYTYFTCEVAGEIKGWPVKNWEHSIIDWFPLHELPEALHPETRRVIGNLEKAELDT